MDSVTLILLASVVGGLAIALLIVKRHPRGSNAVADASIGQSMSTDVINIARIRAAGVGGLGLLAMAAVVAWFVPSIGQTLSIGALLGLGLGVVLILRRRRTGPLPSSSGTAGANTVLSIDHCAASENADTGQPPNGLRAARA